MYLLPLQQNTQGLVCYIMITHSFVIISMFICCTLILNFYVVLCSHVTYYKYVNGQFDVDKISEHLETISLKVFINFDGTNILIMALDCMSMQFLHDILLEIYLWSD